MNEEKLQHGMRQTVKGTISLDKVAEIDPDLPIKIAVARDCRIISSQVLTLATDKRQLQYSLEFQHEHPKAIGVRVIVGPDVEDEALRSIEHQQMWVPANRFSDGVAGRVDLAVSARLYLCWLRCCRTYTVRGRVVCRRWIWDPIEQQFVVCDAPVRGARVTAFDVDCFWWWCRRDEVGSDFTDLNGNFEITFRWCCWWWRPWLLRRWQLDPELVGRIQELLQRSPVPIPLPQPDPVPDFGIFERMAAVADPPALAIDPNAPDAGAENFTALGQQLITRLPDAPELRELRVWPWWPFFDCRPDIVFRVTQDCGEGDHVIYSESSFQARWNIETTLDGVTLVANDDACCGPFCCTDPPDEDCLVFHGVGCGGYPFDQIEQDITSPLAGYGRPGTHDRPFGRTIPILGVFGDDSEVDYYKVQRRRIDPSPTSWEDLPATEVGTFSRGHWLGVFPWYQWETVKLENVAGEDVLRTINRYREEHPEVDTAVDPANGDILTRWVTAVLTSSSETPMAGLSDGLYELRVIGYRYDADDDELFDQKIMALCPPPGEDVDPSAHSTLRLRLDNRVASWSPGSVHLTTTEPECDFPDTCAVVKNEGQPDEECVDPCGFLRVSAGDTITIHFEASDTDGHLEAYSLSAHWAESEVFNVLTAGTIVGDPEPLYGPTYAQTFAGGQATVRAGLPPADPEHDRPFWYGGHFKVTVTVGASATGTGHQVFETCCAYLLRLRVWKRTTNGCASPVHFHANRCEFSFTVIREDLIGNPAHPSCSPLCPEEDQGPPSTVPA